MQSTVSGSRDSTVNKTAFLPSWGCHSSWEVDSQQLSEEMSNIIADSNKCSGEEQTHIRGQRVTGQRGVSFTGSLTHCTDIHQAPTICPALCYALGTNDQIAHPTFVLLEFIIQWSRKVSQTVAQIHCVWCIVDAQQIVWSDPNECL